MFNNFPDCETPTSDASQNGHYSIFVKIPMEINRQFQKQNSKTNLIKAEDIDENQTTAIKTPSRPESHESQSQQQFEDPNRESPLNPDVSLTEPIKCFKCELCPFMTLTENWFNDHVQHHQQHNLQKISRRKLYCAGCSNIFFEKSVLQSHLAEEHLMLADEAVALTEFIEKNNCFGPTKKGKKNRIFIKNVQTLKKPDLLESTEMKEVKKAPPKIFVKSVQLLKNPEPIQNILNMGNTFSEPFDFSGGTDQNSCQNLFPRSSICIKSLETLRDPSITPSFSAHMQSPNYYEPLEDTSLQQLAAIASNLPLQETENENDEDPQSKGKIFIKDINVLQQPLNLNPPMTTLHFDSVSMLGLNDNIDSAFELNSFMHDVHQLQPPREPVMLEELNDLIEVNNNSNFSQNSAEIHSFSELLNNDDDTSCIADKIVNDAAPAEQKSVLLSEKDVTVPDENMHVLHGTVDDEILFVCAEEIINNDIEVKRPEEAHPKGRIYVASNLMENEVHKETQKRPRRRTKSKTSEDKCGMCSWKFKETANLEYHRKCHGTNKSIVCPECAAQFKNFNVLHTHLWRSHKIDMELYSCTQCEFKTPIFARLKNEHAKTHSDAKEFQCDYKNCDKKFKNAKQRKHHRRTYHKLKTQNTHSSSSKCDQCTMVFNNVNLLRAHVRNIHNQDLSSTESLPKCERCSKQFQNVAALKVHQKQHLEEKRYKCAACPYLTNDHNAYRRHKMVHSKATCYQCPYCDYKSIQSTTYRKHLESKHEDRASELVFKCTYCKFVSISRAKYDLHLTKHIHLQDGNATTTMQVDSNNDSVNDSSEEIVDEPFNLDKVQLMAPQQIPSPKLMIGPDGFAPNAIVQMNDVIVQHFSSTENMLMATDDIAYSNI